MGQGLLRIVSLVLGFCIRQHNVHILGNYNIGCDSCLDYHLYHEFLHGTNGCFFFYELHGLRNCHHKFFPDHLGFVCCSDCFHVKYEHVLPSVSIGFYPFLVIKQQLIFIFLFVFNMPMDSLLRSF